MVAITCIHERVFVETYRHFLILFKGIPPQKGAGKLLCRVVSSSNTVHAQLFMEVNLNLISNVDFVTLEKDHTNIVVAEVAVAYIVVAIVVVPC
jgi:hypothetical protein